MLIEIRETGFKRKIINIPKIKEYKDKAIKIFLEGLEESLMVMSKDELEIIKSNDFQEIIDSITKIHQSCELMLSSIILEKNPIMLLKIDDLFEETNDIDFDECITINTDKLLKIAKKIKKEEVKDFFYNDSFKIEGSFKAFDEIFKENRKIRNGNIHGVNRLKNQNKNDLLSGFLLIYNVFFKDSGIIKDTFKRYVLSERETMKEINEHSLNSEDMEIFKEKLIEEKKSFYFSSDFYNIIESKRRVRQNLLNFVRMIENILSKENYEKIIKRKINKNKYVCPNCENSYRTYDGEYRRDFEHCPTMEADSVENLFPSLRSLIEKKKNVLSECYICGFQVEIGNVIRKPCKCCDHDINKKKINSFYTCLDKEKQKQNETCLDCGCTDRDQNHL